MSIAFFNQVSIDEMNPSLAARSDQLWNIPKMYKKMMFGLQKVFVVKMEEILVQVDRIMKIVVKI